jgi:hypothetical protein
MAEETRTTTIHIPNGNAARQLAATLIDESMWFAVTPLRDGVYAIEVEAEHLDQLRQLAAAYAEAAVPDADDANRYDYKNQAWIMGGVYQDCGHPVWMKCDCYGRAHKGERAQ